LPPHPAQSTSSAGPSPPPCHPSTPPTTSFFGTDDPHLNPMSSDPTPAPP
jgi:hypothetical protein